MAYNSDYRYITLNEFKTNYDYGDLTEDKIIKYISKAEKLIDLYVGPQIKFLDCEIQGVATSGSKTTLIDTNLTNYVDKYFTYCYLIIVDDIGVPVISAINFAGEDGVGLSNSWLIDISGVINEDLLNTGSITVSEDCTLQSKTVDGVDVSSWCNPVSLVEGENITEGIKTLLGFDEDITFDVLHAQDIDEDGYLIVIVELKDASDNKTNVTIKIKIDAEASPMVTGKAIGEERFIIDFDSETSKITVDIAFSEAIDNSSIYRIIQKSQFPRAIDYVNFNNSYYKYIPSDIKISTCLQTEWMIKKGLDFIREGGDKFISETMGAYSYQKAKPVNEIEALICPEAKHYLKRFKNRLGKIVI